VPFRKWYGCLGEIRSLAPSTSRLLILTATATKATKGEILSTQQLGEDDIKFIEQSPNQPNLKYSVQYLDKNEALQTAFSALIGDLKNQVAKTPRTLLYCQTRKQCHILFRVFEVCLGKNTYHGENKPQNRIVEMYHTGIPSRIKGHIVESMADEDGHLRVLVSTIAFGMGVNCKQVRRIIHFRPSKSGEMYVQECGRAGRDGLPSTCVLLYNGFLSTHCEKAMKEYLSSSECHRKCLMSRFGFSNELPSFGHAQFCCDICAAACVCGSEVCPNLWSPHRVSQTEKVVILPHRHVQFPARTRDCYKVNYWNCISICQSKWKYRQWSPALMFYLNLIHFISNKLFAVVMFCLP